jgi:hypothetical protein
MSKEQNGRGHEPDNKEQKSLQFDPARVGEVFHDVQSEIA